MHNLNKKNSDEIFFFLYFDLVRFLIVKIKKSKIGKTIKFINVKLKGENVNINITPNKNGKKNITKNLLFKRLVKLNLISFFQFYSSYNSLYF